MDTPELLPASATVSANFAAAILGRRPHAIARLVADGLLVDLGAGHWRRITATSVNDLRGRPITLSEFYAAKAELNQRYVARELRRAAL